jgi:hypothetical protein
LGEKTQSLVLIHKSTFCLQITTGGGEEMGELGSSKTSSFFSQAVGLATMVEEEIGDHGSSIATIFFSTLFSTICSWQTCSSRFYLQFYKL